MGFLRSAIDGIERGRGSIVLIAGEPGIGKSRLMDEIARLAAPRAITAWGRSWEAGGAPAYWLWTEALRAVAAQVGDEWWDEHVAGWAHELRDVLSEAADGGVDPHVRDADEARFRLFAAVARLLEAAAATRPVVLLLDDLHAADTASVLLLRFVARRASMNRLLIVGAYRDVELTASHPFTATLDHLLREPAVTRLTPRLLDVDDVAEIIATTLETTPKPEIAEQVWSQTDGNPLYVRELVRLVTAEGLVGSMPRDLRATILRRLETLPDACRSLLSTASVFGRDVPLDVLGEVTGVDDPLAVLDDAVAANVIGERPDAPGAVRFSHLVVRDALYEEIPRARRASLHHEVGLAIERRRQGDLDSNVAVLALHFSAATTVGGAAKAVHYGRLAGDRAMRLLAFDEAMSSYAVALAAIDTAPEQGRVVRRSLLLQLGEAQARAGATPRAKESFLAAASLARDLHDPAALARAALGYGGRFPWLRAGSDTLIVPLLREARAVVDDDALRARITARLSTALRDEPDRSERTALSEEAVRLADAVGDVELQAYVHIARFTAIWAPETTGELGSIAARAAELARRSGDNERISDAGWLQFISALIHGDCHTARSIAADYARIAVELRQPPQRWYAGVMRDALQLMSGPLDDLETSIELTLEAGRVAQGWDAEVSYRLAIAMLRWEQGRLAEVDGLLARSAAEYRGYPFFGCLLALAHAEDGRAAAASAAAADALDHLAHDNGWLFGITVLSEASERNGDAALAARLYPTLLPYDGLVATAAGEVVGGAVSRSLGQLASQLGRFDDAERHFSDALAVHERMGADVWTAHTLYDHAVMLSRRGAPGDVERAAGLLARALPMCERLGMVALAGRIASAGVAPTPAPPRGTARPGGLTARELEVATLVARGLSNREVADQLVVSERTVESHVQSALRKLDLRSRTQLAAWLLGTSAPQLP